MANLSAKGAKQYAELQAAIAVSYGVPEPTQMFAVEATIAQELNDAITARSDFLEKINVIMVTEIKGEKVFIGVNGPVTGRTNTKENDREPHDVSQLDNDQYELFPTESDVALPYATIDAWAKFPDFKDRYSAAVQKRIAQDRIVVGFHGVSAATQTDRKANPKLQDVNKGWLHQLREKVPHQVMKEGKVAGSGKVTMGKGGDYANLDTLVHDAVQLVDENLREDGDLVAIIGSDLLAADKAKLYSAQGDTPTEKERIELAQVIATYGGKPAYSVPNFPSNAVLVTSFTNLSIYVQESSWRKQTVENPKRNRVEDYNSRNEGYVIEQLEKAALIENVEVLPAPEPEA